MPPLNLLEKYNNSMYRKFSKDMGNSLVILGSVGWIFSALGQLGMIVLNKDIDKKEKKFLIPQEIADGLINVGLYYTICRAIKGFTDSLLENGKFITMTTDKILKKFRTGQSSVEGLIKSFSEEFISMGIVKKNEGGRLSRFYKGMTRAISAYEPGAYNKYNMLEKTLSSVNAFENKDRYIKILKKGLENFEGFKNGAGIVSAIAASVLASSVITPIARNKAANYYQKRAIERGRISIKKPETKSNSVYTIPVSNTFSGFGV